MTTYSIPLPVLFSGASDVLFHWNCDRIITDRQAATPHPTSPRQLFGPWNFNKRPIIKVTSLLPSPLTSRLDDLVMRISSINLRNHLKIEYLYYWTAFGKRMHIHIRFRSNIYSNISQSLMRYLGGIDKILILTVIIVLSNEDLN